MEDIKTIDAKLILETSDSKVSVDLYSQEGLALLNMLYLKSTVYSRLMYEPTWLGIPIIQLPHDIVIMQELIWRLRPDLIIETGVAHGGSLIFVASICEMIGHGQVIGVDVEIRKYNRAAITSHPLSGRIRLIEGSSIDPVIVAQLKNSCQGAARVLVILDSNHTTDHVSKELAIYHHFVTPGSYLVAMDGSQAYVWDVPPVKEHFRHDNPLVAIDRFVAEHPEFRVEPHFTRMGVTSSDRGFLRRLTNEELALL